MVAVQIETGSGSDRATSRFDWLNKRVSFMTGRHIASVAVNAGGTGYANGDRVRLTTNTGAHLLAEFEVTNAVAGVVQSGGLRIVSNGSYGDRLSGTITIGSGGAGYPASVSNLVLEVQGGTSRMPCKILATTNGSGEVTSAVLFEDLGTGGGGIYTVVPSYPAATTAVGPNAVTGSGCTVTFSSSTGVIGSTGLATTAITGSGNDDLTVNVTLADTGWSVDGRNTNKHLINSVNNEKEVVLVGDATGLTNKPYIAYRTATETVSLNTHHAIVCVGLISHNPGLALSSHSPISPGLSGETAIGGETSASVTLPDSGGGVSEVEFWMAADDTHFREIAQLDENAAVSDNGLYWHHYAGFLDRVGVETENPYPLLVFASTRDITTPASTVSYNHTGIAQCVFGGTNGAASFYDNVAGSFQPFRNADAAANPGVEPRVIFPNGKVNHNTGGDSRSADYIVVDSALVRFWGDDDDGAIFDNESNDGVPTRVMRWTPSSGGGFAPFLWPLVLISKSTSTTPAVADRIHGNIKGMFWISSDDGTGQRITNFSEDYVTYNSQRYLCFHSCGRKQAYHYIAFQVN